jgi:DNA polymerase III epsilon subunit-like protein
MDSLQQTINGKNILVLDLETTGFPVIKPGFNVGNDKYYDYKLDSKYEESRIVQVAWAFIEKYNKAKIDLTETKSFLRKPTDFNNVPNSNIHGITTEQVFTDGLILSKIVNDNGLGAAIKKADYIIAHNGYFDIFILLNEFNRIKFNSCVEKLVSIVENDALICTGELGRDVCKLECKPSKYFNYKMPKLEELYFHYYKLNPENRHDAKSDVNSILEILKKI